MPDSPQKAVFFSIDKYDLYKYREFRLKEPEQWESVDQGFVRDVDTRTMASVLSSYTNDPRTSLTPIFLNFDIKVSSPFGKINLDRLNSKKEKVKQDFKAYKESLPQTIDLVLLRGNRELINQLSANQLTDKRIDITAEPTWIIVRDTLSKSRGLVFDPLSLRAQEDLLATSRLLNQLAKLIQIPVDSPA